MTTTATSWTVTLEEAEDGSGGVLAKDGSGSVLASRAPPDNRYSLYWLFVSTRQHTHTSAYVSIRQHTSAYVSIRIAKPEYLLYQESNTIIN